MKLYKILFEGIDGEQGLDDLRFETANGDPLPHHVSLTKFKPYEDPSMLGEEFEITVNGLVVDRDIQKVAAVKVELPLNVKISTGSVPHITVGLFEGGKPVNSQKLEYGKAVPFSMTLKVMLINALDNRKFMDEYEIEEVKANTAKGNAQLVLTRESSDALKDAVMEKLKESELFMSGL